MISEEYSGYTKKELDRWHLALQWMNTVNQKIVDNKGAFACINGMYLPVGALLECDSSFSLSGESSACYYIFYREGLYRAGVFYLNEESTRPLGILKKKLKASTKIYKELKVGSF